jgi:hypothetical protein
VKMGKATITTPKCAACQFGKQGRTPIPGKRVSFVDSGALTKDQVQPGQRIFVDQYESRAPGRTFASKGASSSLKYVGGTLFYDAASGYISIHHQHGFTAAETIQSKIKFEQEAENGIKVVVRNARTMMLHVALRWPGYADQDLWPMAMSHAVHLWNHTPKQASGLAPIEIFSGSKSDHSHLLNAHPWGCPVYILEPKLRDGHKISKWEPRGQFMMGISPNHASSVHLVRNLQTGSITPQFHLVFDDFFETVFSEGEQEPDVWPELVVFQSFANDFDDDDYRPELPDEWLNPTELQDRITTREDERNQILNSLNNQRTQQIQREATASTNDNRQRAQPRNEEQRVTEHPPTPLPTVTTDTAARPPPVVVQERIAAPESTFAPNTTVTPTSERRYPLRNRKQLGD